MLVSEDGSGMSGERGMRERTVGVGEVTSGSSE